jgi:hypothetical protein
MKTTCVVKGVTWYDRYDGSKGDDCVIDIPLVFDPLTYIVSVNAYEGK